MKIVPATISMVPQLMELGEVIFANGISSIGKLDLNSWVAEIWKLLNTNDRRLFVAVDDSGMIIGIHIVMASPVIFNPSILVVKTMTLWVSKEARGLGAASGLHKAAEEWGRKIGAKHMVAGVPLDYSAHAQLGDSEAVAGAAESFYEKSGYEKIETMFMKEIA